MLRFHTRWSTKTDVSRNFIQNFRFLSIAKLQFASQCDQYLETGRVFAIIVLGAFFAIIIRSIEFRSSI